MASIVSMHCGVSSHFSTNSCITFLISSPAKRIASSSATQIQILCTQQEDRIYHTWVTPQVGRTSQKHTFIELLTDEWLLLVTDNACGEWINSYQRAQLSQNRLLRLGQHLHWLRRKPPKVLQEPSWLICCNRKTQIKVQGSNIVQHRQLGIIQWLKQL